MSPVPTRLKEFNSLKCLSAKLGRDPLVAQAASGNTSIKIDGTLWIKASGKWLADADIADIFVPVDLDTMASVDGPLVPSIETAMHAAIPRRVVIHVHSVNAISWAVREDGPSRVAERLAGLDWAWIPYVASGVPLAREIRRAGAADVFLLASHGLVVAADTCDQAANLLADVEARLAVPAREAPAPDRPLLDWISRGSGWRAPSETAVHCLATDPDSIGIFAAGTLYPCHAMFLGPGSAECAPGEPPGAGAARYRSRHGRQPYTLCVRGTGLLVSDDITITQTQVLIGLAHVIQRIPGGSSVRYLTDRETVDLVNADVHRYRENVEARRALVSH